MASRRRPADRPRHAGALARLITRFGHHLELTAAAPREPTVVLVVATDSRHGLTHRLRHLRHDIEGRRADAIGLLVVPIEGPMYFVRVPRDAFMNVEGVGYQRIGWALSYRGRQCLLDSIRSGVGVPVHHYVEIGFVPFARLATALGGLSSKDYGPRIDHRTGLDSSKRRRLWGRQVLALARSRTPNDQNLTDEERIAVQNRVLADLAGRRSTARLLLGALAVVPRLGRDLVVDDAWDVRELQWLTDAIRTRDLKTISLPVQPARVGGSRRSPFTPTFDSSSPTLEIDDAALAWVRSLARGDVAPGAEDQLPHCSPSPQSRDDHLDRDTIPLDETGLDTDDSGRLVVGDGLLD